MITATRTVLVAVPLVLGGAAAGAWFAWPTLREPAPGQWPAAPAAPAALPAPAAAPRPAPVPEAARSGAAPAVAPAPAARRLEAPRFDIVRVGARGNAVVAGRATPGAEVVLLESGREIGRTRADSRGEWVILPDSPVAAGARELSLRARLPDGQEMPGEGTVLVVVPEGGTAVARGAPGGESPAEAGRQAAVPPAGERPGAAARPGAGVAAEPAAGDSAGAVRPGAEQWAANRPAAGGAGANPPAPAGVDTTAARSTGAVPPAGSGAAAVTAEAAAAPLVLLLPPGPGAAPRPLQGGTAALGVDIVDYDETGNMRFAGSAPSGSQLRVYADNRLLGDVRADESGRWTLAPDTLPEPGRHTLRVDRLSPGRAEAPGAVAARVEVAFQREHLPEGTLRDGRVVVQPGNNLWRIAREAYGRGARYTVIFAANRDQIRDARRIYPGQVLGVPDAPPAIPAEASRSR
ncbi:LysM peptidoglycan-binding domain-containing protein [Roseomonas sp. BN140053]|uniref:LysM peptidoglycan-binding domain-containing protein n=1 Tax=Roseomonas sp. BN140053 TaxID=3391898 RepID=UPI0039EA842C